jgi:isochorismate synthase
MSSSYNPKLSGLFEVLHDRKIPFALYRLPHDTKISLLIQYKSFPDKLNNINDLDNEEGFVFAPFPDEIYHDVFLLKPEVNLLLNDITDDSIDTLISELSSIEHFKAFSVPECKLEDTTKEQFTDGVSKSVQAIKEKNFFKVILSKIRVEDKPADFNPFRMFLELCNNYSHALVYYWQLPGIASWMGATPEPVLREKNGKIYTVSLAGTQLLGDKPLSEVCWREKEIAEQAIVSRFIVQLIDKLGISEMNIIGPHNFQAGNLVHLNTGFEFDADLLKMPRGTFIAALHPTPSIAGLPRNNAIKFIQENELHSRSYYAGLLGPYFPEKEIHLFVNLRCMQLFEDKLVLYSGAGITADSDPEKEWIETDNKMMTLLNVLYVQTGN